MSTRDPLEVWKEVKELVSDEVLSDDVFKAFAGNSAASARVRKTCMNVSKLVRELRKLNLEFDKANKEKRAKRAKKPPVAT